MTTDWNQIADSLRQEIADLGGLFKLFEEQQRRLVARDADGVLRLGGEIEVQVCVLNRSRQAREELVVAYAVPRGQPPTAQLRALLPEFPAVARPLMDALISEVNVLIHRVRRISRQNHSLLASAVEIHQQVLQQLFPGTFTQTYAPDGRFALRQIQPSAALRAAG